MSEFAKGESGVHWDTGDCASYGTAPPPYAAAYEGPCSCGYAAPYASGSGYAYPGGCACTYPYYSAYEYSSGYGYDGGCPRLSAAAHPVAAEAKPGGRTRGTAATTGQSTTMSAHATTAATVAEPASLPLTGENAVLALIIGAAITSVGMLVRYRIESW